MPNFNQGRLKYIIGDATAPQTSGNCLIIHISNDIGAWAKGFVVALSKRWKKPEEEYRRWFRSKNAFQLGNIQEVRVQTNISVVNMIAQHGIYLDEDGNPPIRYDALEKCLGKVLTLAKDTDCSIHAPRFGSGLAGGDWNIIEKLIKDIFIPKGVNVTIYDLPPSTKKF